jgi:peptidyl-prolyl cis-trans isomerase SurA
MTREWRAGSDMLRRSTVDGDGSIAMKAMAEMVQFFLRRAGAAAAVAVLLATAAGPVAAQNVVVVVNGEPVTALDIEMRGKFIQLSTHKAPPREEVINELIDEKLKIKEGKRWGIDISENDIESMYSMMSGRMRLTADQMTQTLAKSGISPNTLKTKLRADQVWQQLIRGRYQASLQLTDKEVLSALEAKKPDEADTVAYDYIMRPVLLLIPPGSPPAAFEARRKEAEALRARFKTCAEGIAIARTLRDTAVRDQVIRSGGDLPLELRKLLDSVPIGQLTAPEVTKLGIEMFALCAKHESKADTPGKRQAREAVLSERFERQSKQYLARLRREALIERK